MENTTLEKRKTLHEILCECEFYDEVDAATGEITTACDESVELKSKVDAYGYVFKRMEAEYELAKSRRDAWTDRVRKMDTAMKTFKQNVKYGMETLGIEKLEGTETRFSFRSSQKVVVTDQSALPTEFVRTVIETTPDKDAIKKAIKSGVDVPGAELSDEKNLQIK